MRGCSRGLQTPGSADLNAEQNWGQGVPLGPESQGSSTWAPACCPSISSLGSPQAGSAALTVDPGAVMEESMPSASQWKISLSWQLQGARQAGPGVLGPAPKGQCPRSQAGEPEDWAWLGHFPLQCRGVALAAQVLNP